MELQQGMQLLGAAYGLIQGPHPQGQATLAPPVGYQQGLPLAHLHIQSDISCSPHCNDNPSTSECLRHSTGSTV